MWYLCLLIVFLSMYMTPTALWWPPPPLSLPYHARMQDSPLETLQQCFNRRLQILRHSPFLLAINTDNMQHSEMNRPEGHEIF